MPKWTMIEEIGILMRDGHGYILSMGDGAHWRLDDIGSAAIPMLGRRVRVRGMRVDFNTISVDGIDPDIQVQS